MNFERQHECILHELDRLKFMKEHILESDPFNLPQTISNEKENKICISSGIDNACSFKFDLFQFIGSL